MHKISFIGAGNMGGALIRAVCKATPPEDVIVFDSDGTKSAALAFETACDTAHSLIDAVSNTKYIVYCVKPQILETVLTASAKSIAEAIAAGQHPVIVSIAAGVSLETISVTLSNSGIDTSRLPIIRIMPNIPASVGRGTLLVASNNAVHEPDIANLELLLAHSGIVERTDENTLNLGTAISGCVPAFAFMFIEALADGGVAIGLTREKALLYAAQTVAGAADMLLATGTHPGALKDSVCSPGGSTIAGVMALEHGAFRGTVAQAVIDADARNRQLG